MNIKLMVIDDEKSIRDTIRDYFEDSGWNVATFSSGEDALEFLQNETAEYIIVDGRLPGMTGTDFIRKASQVRSGIKYLIYTGSCDFQIADDLRASGITERNIVMKPVIDFTDLHNALEQINK
jgi:DNA-binding NtrC family response regulator